MKSYSQQKVNGFYKSHAANKGLNRISIGDDK